MELVAEVAVESALFYFDRLFSYRIPAEIRQQIRRGVRVLVPFGRGNRKVQGLVFSIKQEDADRQLKSILAVLIFENAWLISSLVHVYTAK